MPLQLTTAARATDPTHMSTTTQVIAGAAAEAGALIHAPCTSSRQFGRALALPLSISFLLLLIALIPALIPALSLTSAQPAPPTGSYVAVDTWDASTAAIPAGLWADPAGIDLMPSGRFAVSDQRFKRVEVLEADGTGRVLISGALASPGHLAADEVRDRLYVVDAGKSEIAVFRLDGTPVTSWTGIGGAAGVAVAPSDGRVAVSDTAGDVVRWFAVDGTPGDVWGGTGSGPGQLDSPAGLHIASDGRTFVADRGNTRIVIFAVDGRPSATINTDTGELAGAEPLDVHVDGDDVWVATSAGLGRIDLASRRISGALIGISARAVSGSSTHGLLAAGVPGAGHPGVWRFRHKQASGEPMEVLGGPLTVPGYFDGVEAISIGDDSKAYLVDVPPRLQRFALDGSAEAQIVGPDVVEVDADASGQVYAVDEGGTVHAFAADGSPRWTARFRATGVPAEELEPVAIAWDESADEVLILEAVSGKVYRFDAAGGDAGTWSPVGAVAGKARLVDLAIAADGSRYALDVSGAQVRGWDSDGRLNLEIHLPKSARGAERLDVLPDGTIVVLTGDGWGFRFARDATVMTVWEAGRLDRGDSRPADIAADAAGRVYVTDRGVDVVTVFEWDPEALSAEPLELEEGCAFRGEKGAAPSEVAIGEEVEITLSIRGACAASRSGVDLAVILDTSISRGSTRGIRSAVEHMLELLTPGVDQVAIYGGQPTRLSGDVQLVRRILRRTDLGQSDWLLLPPLQQAAGELYSSRSRSGSKKVIVILMSSDGIDDEAQFWEQDRARREIVREAGQVGRRGTEIFGIWFKSGGAGRSDGEHLLADVVSTSRHMLDGGSERALESVFARIFEQVKPTSLLTEVVITDTLPANMPYVEGSSAPPAEKRDRTLVWRLVDVPVAGTGVRFRIRPTDPGEWPTNELAYADGYTPDGKRHRIDFPVPLIRVLAAPTPLPTLTVAPSPTPTFEPTLTPDPTPTSIPAPIYLPISLREACDAARSPFDVAIVIDTSTSMEGEDLAAAADAALRFVDAMRLPGDRVSIVTFNSTAAIRLALTGDRTEVVAALRSLPESVAAGTRIDFGLTVAREALEPLPRTDGRVPVAVLLTDGRDEGGDELTIGIADELRDSGVALRVVGLGDGIDEVFLQRIAGDLAAYRRAPSADELSEIFSELAEAFGLCPPELFWGRR